MTLSLLSFFKSRSKLQAARETIRNSQSVIDQQNSKIAQIRSQVADTRDINTIAHNSAEGMDSFFENIECEEHYIEFGEALNELTLEHGIDMDGKSIADLGCGPAVALKLALSDATPAHVTGYDFSKTALEYARTQLPNATFIQRDIYNGDGQQYDIVFCTEVLEHIEKPDLALVTLLSMLKEGGTALLTVPDGRSDKSKYHINFWSPESWCIFVGNHTDETSFDTSFGAFKAHQRAEQCNNFAIIRKRTAQN